MFGRHLIVIMAGALALLFLGTRAYGQAVIDVPLAVGDGLTTTTQPTLWDAIDAAVDGDTIRINVFEITDTVEVQPAVFMPRINFPSSAQSRTIAVDLTINAVVGNGDGSDSAVAITAGNGDGTGTTATVLTIQGNGDGDSTTLGGLEFYFFSNDNPVDLDGASATFDRCKFASCADASVRVSNGTESLPLTFSGCEFNLCSTANGGGPALRIDDTGDLSGDLSFIQTTITNCSALAGNSIGGGIEILSTANGVTVEFMDSTVTNNVAVLGAGAMRIAQAGDDFTLRIRGTAAGGGTSLSSNSTFEGTGGAISIEAIGARGILNVDAAGGDVTIEDNGSSVGNLDAGGAIYIGDGGTMTTVSLTASGVGNLSVQNNVSDNGPGGAIRMPDLEAAATISISNSGSGDIDLSNNTSSGDGGAISFTGGSLDSLSVTSTGGGDLSINNNTAGNGDGGAIWLPNLGENATITFSRVGVGTLQLSGNTATGAGGAISAGNAGTNLICTMLGVTIDGNTATGGTGGVLDVGDVIGFTLVLDDSTIQNNSSTGGGAFFVDNCFGDLDLDLDPATGPLVLSDNTATGGQGGAIRAALVTGSVTCLIQSTTQPVTVTGNSAGGGDGGAIRIDSCVTLDITLATGAEVCTLTGNTSTAAGGVLSVGNAAGDASITINSSVANTLLLGNNTAGTDGGAVRVGSIGGALTLNVGATASPNFPNNSATTGDGGCISIGTTGDASLLQFVSGIFTNNTAGNGDGGAVYIASIGTNSTIDLGTVNFNVNTAQGNGGAICIDSMGAGAGVIVESVSMISNVAVAGDGGALYIGTVTDTTVDIGEVGLAVGSPTFDGNQATGGNGGAISIGPVIGIANMQIVSAVETVTFIGNVCGGNGGGVHLLADSGSITLQNLVIDGTGAGDANTAGTDGGFLSASALNGGVINILNCIFIEQEAGVNGGALAFDGISDTAVVNVTGGSVTDCAALGGDGGGIYVGALADFAQVNLDGGLTLDGNTALNNGGGIALGQLGSDPVITIDTITVDNNTATNGSGGGVWLSGDATGGTVDFLASSFTGNAVGIRGGGVCIDGLNAAAITITGLTLDSNVQAGGGDPTEGGGLSIFGTPTTVALDNCDIINNVSGSDGGGLWVSVGPATIMTMTDLIVEGNTANGSGGGMRLAGGSLVTITSTPPLIAPPINHPISDIATGTFSARISGNTSSFDGGGIVWDPQFAFPIPPPRGTAFTVGLRIDSVQIDGNTSTTGSGGGLRFDGGPAFVRNCPVTGNTSFLDGGGIQVDAGDVRIQNCRIGGTFADRNTTVGDGGGINVNTLGTGLAVIRGCGICENLPDQVSPALQSGDASPTAPASVDDGVNDYDIDGDAVCLEAALLVIMADGLGDAVTPALAVQGVAPFGRAVIEVEPGTYTGTIDILSKNVTIIGLGINGDPSTTVLQGNGVDGAVVVVRSVSEAWLECLTISGGIEDSGNGHFGGVFISGSQAFLDIENCQVTLNNGGGIVVDGGATATVRNSEIGSVDGADSHNTSATVGGGVRIIDGDITLLNTDVKFNVAGTNGGGLWINDIQNGTREQAFLTGCAVDQNVAGDDGGGFWLGDQGSVTHDQLTGDPPTVLTNEAGNDGGGIHLDETSTFTMTGNAPDDMGLVSGNTAVNDGGGITVGSNSIATLTDVEIGSLGDGNIASHDGGGVHMVASGELVVNVGSTMIDNSAPSGKGGHLMFEGGGAAISFAPPAGFEVTGGQAIDGGSIAFQNGSLDLTSITVLASSATNDGGVIWAGDNAPLTLTSVLFDGTIDAGGDGGCIRSGIDSDLTVVNSTLGNGTVTAIGDGGIVKIVGGAGVLASIEGTNLVGGTAGGNGGGLQMDEGMLILDTLLIDDCQAVNGGGIWISGLVIASATDCNITDCTAVEGVGGLAALDAGAILTVDTTGVTVLLTGGLATTAVPGGGLGRGGAFHVAAGSALELLGTGGALQISGAQAEGEGGAFAVDATGTVVVTDATIQNCQASLDGGVAYINGTVTFNDVTITGSSASQDGGMAYVATESASLVLGAGTSMATSIAGRDGGHLWFPDLAVLATPPMTLAATVTFASGTAGNDGGAIRFGDNTQWSVSNYDLSGNVATAGDGGCIRTGDASAIQLTGCNLSSNTSGGDGGAIRVGNGFSTITLTDASLSGSSAGGFGGAVAAGTSATVLMASTGAQVDATSCSGNGGGVVSVGISSIVSISDHATTNCQSSAGGGLVNSGDGSVITLTDVSAVNTVAAGAGGLVLTGVGSSVTLTDVTATNVESQITGGGLVFTGDVCTVILTNVSASGAKAIAGVGGVVAMGEDAVLTMNTVTAQNCQATGNGGVIRVLSNAILNVTSCDFAGSSSAAGSGGVLYAENWDSFPFSPNIPFTNTTLSGGSAAIDGGAIRAGGILGNVSVSLVGCDVSNRTAGGNGGGISVTGLGIISVNGGSLSGGTAGGSGGGVYISGQGIVTIVDSSLASCDANGGDGGAIHVTDSSTISVTNTPLTGSTATGVGGAIAMGEDATLTLATVTAQNCQAAGNGGAIRVLSDAILDITACDFNGCSSTGGSGGVLYTGDWVGAAIIPNIVLDTIPMSNGSAGGGDGGAIRAGNNAWITITNGIMSNRTAVGSGGGIYVDGTGTVEITGNTLANCDALAGDGGAIRIVNDSTVTVTNTPMTGCTATGVGGAIAMGENAILTMDTVTAQNCQAAGNGGAIRVLSEAVLDFDDCDFSGSTSTLGSGGVLYTEDWAAFPVAANIPFLNTPLNTGSAALNGGAIHAGDNAWVELINSNASARTSGAFGGSVYLDGEGQVDVLGGSLANCQAGIAGGGIFVTNSGTVTVTGSSLAGCDALGGEGGAISMADNSTVTVTSTPLTGSTATGVGGAIAMGENALLTMDTLVATGCSAVGDGGVVRVEQNGNVTCIDCSVGGSSTAGHGGGFSLGSGTVAVMTDNTFANCSATADGGGIQHDGDLGATLTITNCDFSGNSATSGGAVNLDPGTSCDIVGGIWANNSATADGGHISLGRDGLIGDSSTMTIDGGPSFTNGSAGDQGGVLYGSGSGSITISGILATSMSASSADFGGALAVDQDFLITANQLDISTCTADAGGGVHVSDTGTITLTNSSIDTCSADNGGGGYIIGTLNMSATSANGNQATARDGGHLYYETGSDGDIQNCDFDNGTSQQGGGAVLLEAAANPSFSAGCTFDDDQAGTNGGDVLAQAGALGQFSNCTFTDGAATGNGGGVWAGSNAQTMFTDCTFSNTSAVVGGGMYLEEASIIVTDTTIQNATVSGDRGCGVYALTATAVALPVFNGGTISNCDVTFAGGSFGGGLYLQGTAGMFTMIDTIVTLCDTDYGGGAYIDGADPLLGATFNNCTATYFGGGTYIDDNSTVAYSNANYVSNVSLYRGGGVYVYPSTNASFTWVDGSVINNGSPRGGGVYVADGGSGAFTDVLFQFNTASEHGAGLSAYTNSIIQLDGCNFERNTCPAGGGIYLWRTTMSVTGASVFDANTASWGPAIYAHNSQTTMNNSLFSDNVANYDGGAVYLKGGGHTLAKVAFNSNSSIYGSVDGLAMIGTSDFSDLMLDNCYFGNMAHTGFSAASSVTGSYGDLVSCNVGALVADNSSVLNFGGHIELSSCTSEVDLVGIIDGSMDDVDNNWVVDTLMGDLDGDGAVGANDLIILLQSLQNNSNSGDIDGNGSVDVRDIIMLLMAWS